MSDFNREIDRRGLEMTSPYNDGFTQFYHKQYLYKIKWQCEKWLEKSSKFVGEEEFLQENNKLNDLTFQK
jgi:hypothetical protein